MQVSYTLGVDAGNISVIDYDYLIFKKGTFGKTAVSMCKKLMVEPGSYKITIDIEDSYNGRITQTHTVTTNGILIFGDMCYLFSATDGVEHSTWISFLTATDYLHHFTNHFFSVNTGGDGEFECTFIIEKV